MSKILDLPISENKKLQKAINLFDRGTADLALAEFTKLIAQGCDEAFSFVGNLYEFGGRNVERDYSKARFYYEQSVERVGAVAAYLGLTRIYYYGLGVERDCSKALEYCMPLSGEADHPYAHFYMGRMHMEGCCVDKDIEIAKDFFEKSWRGGYVFGLTYLGIAEQQSGHKLLGWFHRIKAGLLAFIVSLKNINDARIREI